MKIYTASDHAGFKLKEFTVELLRGLGHEVEDCGAQELKKDDDYPEIIACAASRISADVTRGQESKAIIFGKTGEGEAIVANRFPGVRAAVYYGGNLDIVKLSREHNDANVLSLGAGFLNEQEAEEAIRLWLGTPFSGEERHVFRIQQIEEVANVKTE